MVIVLPNGKIFDFSGPYFSDGKHNDSEIWLDIEINNSCNIKDILSKDDKIIADKGFSHLKDNKFEIIHPYILKKDKKQLSSFEANKSRLITKMRNVNERVFGRIKNKYKFFYNIIDTNYIPIFHNVLRIFGSIENKYGSILFKEKDEDEFQLEYFRNNLNKKNQLKKFLIDKNCIKINFNEIRKNFPVF